MSWKKILKTEKKLDKDEPFEKKAKPDYIDLDKDGNTTEPMKQAAKDAKKKSKSRGAFTDED